MRWRHEQWRRDVSLLAADALAAEERAAVETHVAGCAECAGDLSALRAALGVAASDSARGAEPSIPIAWLRSRVEARLDAAVPEAPRRWATGWMAAAAAAGLAVALAATLRTGGTPAAVTPVADAEPEAHIAVSDEALDRMERTMARERAVRYLDEAQDVLVTVSGAPQRCHRKDQHVDMADESRRSRELLARRARLDLDGSAAMTAGPVLDDVERMLREVASLENCARRKDVEAIHRQVETERLLMKIDITTRELAG